MQHTMAHRPDSRFCVSAMTLGLTIDTQALVRTSLQVGVVARVLELPETIDDAGLQTQIEALNADESVQGILTAAALAAASLAAYHC